MIDRGEDCGEEETMTLIHANGQVWAACLHFERGGKKSR